MLGMLATACCLRNWRLLQRAISQSKIWPGFSEACGQQGMSNVGDTTTLRTLHITSGAILHRTSDGPGFRTVLHKQLSSVVTLQVTSANPVVQAVHISTCLSLRALKDVLPFTIHRSSQPANEAELEHINDAFQQLSKDPLYQFSSLKNTPIKVTFDGLKTPESKSLLEYANLVEQEQEEQEQHEPTQLQDDDEESTCDALYQFVTIKAQADDT